MGTAPQGSVSGFSSAVGMEIGVPHTRCDAVGLRPLSATGLGCVCVCVSRLLPSLCCERGLCAAAAPSGAGVWLPWHERAFQESLRPGAASGNRSRGGGAGLTMPVCARHLGGTRWHCVPVGCIPSLVLHKTQQHLALWVPLGSSLHDCFVR